MRLMVYINYTGIEKKLLNKKIRLQPTFWPNFYQFMWQNIIFPGCHTFRKYKYPISKGGKTQIYYELSEPGAETHFYFPLITAVLYFQVYVWKTWIRHCIIGLFQKWAKKQNLLMGQKIDLLRHDGFRLPIDAPWCRNLSRKNRGGNRDTTKICIQGGWQYFAVKFTNFGQRWYECFFMTGSVLCVLSVIFSCRAVKHLCILYAAEKELVDTLEKNQRFWGNLRRFEGVWGYRCPMTSLVGQDLLSTSWEFTTSGGRWLIWVFDTSSRTSPANRLQALLR